MTGSWMFPWAFETIGAKLAGADTIAGCVARKNSPREFAAVKKGVVYLRRIRAGARINVHVHHPMSWTFGSAPSWRGCRATFICGPPAATVFILAQRLAAQNSNFFRNHAVATSKPLMVW